MRKKLLIVMFAALCCNVLFAQGDDRPFRIAAGPKLGVGMAFGSHSNEQNLDFGSALGYQLGASFNAHFGRRYEMSDGGTGWLAIEVEAMYGKNSLKLGTEDFSISCIEVPVLAQLYLTSTVGLEAGVTLVKFTGVSPAKLKSDGATYSVGDITGGDAMITAGLCYKTPNGIMIDARYNLGMSSLNPNFDTKVSSFMISVAYLFNIVK